MQRMATLYFGETLGKASKAKKIVETIKASTVLVSLGCVVEFGLEPTTHILREVLTFGLWG